MEALETIKEVISDTLGIDDEKITDNVKFEELDIDSLDMVELISELEDRFEIELVDVENIETPAQLAEYINKVQGA